ncbi:MAG: class I poly(R)-hydroxyalkanoic acid synthase, partial [Proteobacteria bacterium]|nr:class I poly(R)-hydroxyalkanoic acid synthase [Pseudomonadota bacterium]
MSDNTTSNDGFQAMMQAGQAMMQGFFETLAKQQVAMQDSTGLASTKIPMPDNETLTRLQK